MKALDLGYESVVEGVCQVVQVFEHVYFDANFDFKACMNIDRIGPISILSGTSHNYTSTLRFCEHEDTVAIGIHREDH